MIKNAKLLEEFEKECIIKHPLSYHDSLKLLDGMWELGMHLGVLPPEDPLEGIEVDIRVARILNCLKKR
ncbi:MAG: hypothetical protein QHH74_05370 [Spirochaetota bacterium]|nr:hypothetical protein [Spirochaetota bacterium]